MKIKLLEPFRHMRAEFEWNCPMASLARKLIEDGKALAVEECDLHLNPAEGSDDEPDSPETESVAGTGVEPAKPKAKTAKKPAKPKAKTAKK